MQLDTLDTVKSVVTQTFILDSEDKTEFIKWRACGFSSEEARKRIGLTIRQLELWYVDTEFVNCVESIPRMQEQLAEYFQREDELKSQRRLAEIDARVLDDALDKGIGNLDKQTFEYVQSIRKTSQITPAQKAGLGVSVTAPTPKTLQEALELMQRGSDNAREEKERKEVTIIESESSSE